MKVERVYDWTMDDGLSERDATVLDPGVRPPDSVRFGHLSDSHLGKGVPGRRLAELRRWLEAMGGLAVDAVIHSGDLLETPEDEGLVDETFALFEGASMPVYGVPGNHDVKIPGEPSEVWRRWGPFPRCELVGAVPVWLVDSMAYPPAGERSQRERENAKESGFFSTGAVGGEQLEELKRQMADQGAPVGVLAVHHHLRQAVPPKPWYEQNKELMAPLRDADELLRVARRGGVRVVLHGHRHQYISPYMPHEELVILNGGSATAGKPSRARVIDLAASGAAARIWELHRFR